MKPDSDRSRQEALGYWQLTPVAIRCHCLQLRDYAWIRSIKHRCTCMTASRRPSELGKRRLIIARRQSVAILPTRGVISLARSLLRRAVGRMRGLESGLRPVCSPISHAASDHGKSRTESACRSAAAYGEIVSCDMTSSGRRASISQGVANSGMMYDTSVVLGRS
ncbi:hypothetical protein [Burkholderia sp. S171]|uniref:hypothetical protein n=1 Tax=Burkholderia sp. S171 TaxID=1641860 RepID=UPI00131C63D1|nr:hypothetical protein [Burkholderia sp. S171]